MTRDGTLVIENGRLTRGLRNLRFNDSVLGMLERAEGWGREAEPTVFDYTGNCVVALSRLQTQQYRGAHSSPGLLCPWALLLVVGVIRRQSRHSRFIRFEQPHSPQVKILYQFLILISHILRPDDVGSINVSPVVNPFVNRIVTGTVTNNDEMPVTHMAEAFQDFGTLPMPGISSGIPRHSDALGADIKEKHGKTCEPNDRDERSSQIIAGSPPLLKVAQPLNHDGVNDAGQRSKIMRLLPGLNG